jgi:hypothetical protein
MSTNPKNTKHTKYEIARENSENNSRADLQLCLNRGQKREKLHSPKREAVSAFFGSRNLVRLMMMAQKRNGPRSRGTKTAKWRSRRSTKVRDRSGP